MHGVKRSRISAQAKEERKAKEAAKLKGYLTLEDQFFDAVRVQKRLHERQ